MSALSSLIIVLVLRGDKKGRDWFSFERIWKRTLTAQTQPSAAATSRSRLTAGCCRSRFVVAFDRGRKQRSVAAAGAARRRRERRVAAPLGASVWSVFFSKYTHSKSQKPTPQKRGTKIPLSLSSKEFRHDKVRTAHSMCLSCPADRHSVAPDSLCNPGKRTLLFQNPQKQLLFCKLRNILPRPHRTATSKWS